MNILNSKYCKHFLLLIISIITVLHLSSCVDNGKEKFLQEFNAVVSLVEKDYSHYSKEEWAKADADMKRLQDQWEVYRSKLLPTQNDQINVLIGKYNALRWKDKTSDFLDSAKDIMKQGKAFIEELVDSNGAK
jgi:hypothetical protein